MPKADPPRTIELTPDEFSELMNYFSKRTDEGRILVMLAKILFRHSQRLLEDSD